MTVSAAECRLVRSALPAPARPTLDAAQQRVVDHRSGPLLVLAGPGTGKTTTLVEAVAAKVQQGMPLEQILVLTFSRKAALELRQRITLRLGLTTSTPSAWTFHSFCFALLRAHGDGTDDRGDLRLLSGAEQDVVLRELLRGVRDDGNSPWPAELSPALDTLGFAEEVRALFARTREVGLGPMELAHFGASAGRDSWSAAARFLDGYLDVLDALGALDYAELVHRAVLLAGRPSVNAELRARFGAVFVDEYQDTDPAQEALLQQIAGDGRDLVVVGDPDQSIYAFRGADVAAILEFPERFRRASGEPANVIALETSRRAGRRLLLASRSVATRLPMPGLPAAVVARHRELVAADGTPAGRVEVRTYASPAAELAATADVLRRAHLHDGIAWDDMAVLVRSGARSIPALRRALTAAGVPVEVAGDELPLAREPAVAPLLTALRVAVEPATLTPDVARDMLLSPLGGADATDLRRLARLLRRRRSRVVGADVEQAPSASSGELLAMAVADPSVTEGLDPRTAAPVRQLHALLRGARGVLDEGGSPEDALWSLWSGTGWSARLERASFGGGAAGRAADRDLDAVLALFEAFDRAEQRRGRRGLANVLAEIEAQQIPADTLAERGLRGSAVRLLTAHRSKGLEWDLVIVPGVQEGIWPDLRRRGTLLQPDRLAADGLREAPTARQVLAEERRLFYVACTRAERRLVVSAVASADDDGERPSRFLDELGVAPVSASAVAGRELSLRGLVADLRRTAVDPDLSPALRRAAAVRLARLAHERRPDGRPLVPSAEPDRWWGVAEATPGVEPVTGSGALRLSGTTLGVLDVCPLQWLFRHGARAETPTSTAMGFGGLLHQLADDVASSRVDADLDALMERVDRVWDRLAYDAPWESARQRDEAREALVRFCAWHEAHRGRRLLATEAAFDVPLQVAGRDVSLRGRMDRVELDDDGRVHIVDFKTGSSTPANGDVETNPQLGVYQLAVREGALGDTARDDDGMPLAVGGAELVHLRHSTKAGQPKVQEQGALAGEAGTTWIDELLASAVARLTGEDLPAVPGTGCERCSYRRVCPAQPEGRQVVS